MSPNHPSDPASPPLLHWEDFPPGTVLECGTLTVDREEVLDFARRFDPQPFHLDEAAAARTHFGGLVASGWHTAALAMRLMCDGYLHRAASLGSPGIDKLSVAPDFTFANTRTVALDLKASAEVLGKSGWASVQIARPDGKLLYQGPIGVGHPLTARIALASKDAAVNATLITEDGARHDARIAVSNNSAQHNF